MAVNKNESNRAIEVKRRSGDSGKYGVECNGANTASQNVGGATLPLVGTSTDVVMIADSILKVNVLRLKIEFDECLAKRNS